MRGERGIYTNRDVYISRLRSRSSDQTRNAMDDDLDEDDYAAVRAALQYAADHELMTATVKIGENRSYTHQLAVHPDAAPVLDRMETLYDPVDADDPDFVTYMLPPLHEAEPDADREQEPSIVVYPEEGLTFVLGSGYTGEAKKAGLRNVMYDIKQDGGLPLHAGCRRVVTDDGVEYEAFAGLSGTGKTTLVNTSPRDGASSVVQDDVISILPDGSVAGTEPGMYAKTHDLDETDPMYTAVTHPDTRWDNVAVDEYGNPDFTDDTLTRNGRAAVPRHAAPGMADSIDMPGLDRFYHITRNELMPPAVKLTPEQSAALFALGESQETGAADPDRVGEAVNVFGYNPFVTGSRREEVDRFHEFLDRFDIDSYVLNTGYVGDPSNDITVEDTRRFLDGIIHDEIDWVPDPSTGLEIPDTVRGGQYHPAARIDDFEREWAELSHARHTILDEYDLPDEIVAALR